MDASVFGIFAAGGAVIAVAAYFTLPRWPEDYFEIEMSELASLTTSHPTSRADHCADPPPTGEPVEGDGLASFIHHSDLTPMGPKDGAASPCPVGGPVAFHSVKGCGVAAQSVRSRWPRPVLFRVK